MRIHLYIIFLSLLPLYLAAQDDLYSSKRDKSKEIVNNGKYLPSPFKGANSIMIATEDSSDVAYKKLKLLLLQQGFAITHSENDVFSVNANSKAIRGVEVFVSAYVNEGKIYLSGRSNDRVSDAFNRSKANGEGNIQFRGMKGSPLMIAWDKMEEIAKAYSGGTIFYGLK